MKNKLVKPSRELAGTVTVPGDKSISHRLAMLSALASGETVIDGYLLSEDCVNTLKAVENLGAGIQINGSQIRIAGTGGVFSAPKGVLDMGNSGTGIRLLAGLLAGQSFASEMTGDESLRSRPMGRIKKPLEMMGARIELLGKGVTAPIRIEPAELHAIEYELPMASAQVKSCILMAGLFASGRTTVIEPRHTRDHTEKLMTAMGVPVEVKGTHISIMGTGGKGVRFKPGEWVVPGDFSSAAFWLVGAACMPGAEVTVKGVGLNPRRTALLDVLRRMGADISIHQSRTDGPLTWEETGTVTIKGAGLTATEVGGDEIPNLIDELPLVAVAGALAEGKTVIKDASELRVKESDRIATVAAGLRRLGVSVEEKQDGMIIDGASGITGGGEIDSHGDHRIAMAMSVLALFADRPVNILNTDCIATSYPSFWEDMEALIQGE